MSAPDHTSSGKLRESTGAWTTWSTKSLTASLNAGGNTIRLQPTTADRLPNVDHLDVGLAVR